MMVEISNIILLTFVAVHTCLGNLHLKETKKNVYSTVYNSKKLADQPYSPVE